MYTQRNQRQLRSKAIKMHIANTDEYAMRKLSDADIYKKVSGDFTVNESTSSPNPVTVNTRKNLKFRTVGPPIQTVPGKKELHLSFKGKVHYQQDKELETIAPLGGSTTELRPKPANMDDDEWRRLKRYAEPLILLDVELYCQTRGPLTPLRLPTQTEIDTDWSPNAPVSRTNVLNMSAHYSNGKADGSKGLTFWDKLAFAVGIFDIQMPSFTPTPVAQVDTLAPIIVPVVTLHIGGRSVGAHDIDIDLDLEGTVFYEYDVNNR